MLSVLELVQVGRAGASEMLSVFELNLGTWRSWIEMVDHRCISWRGTRRCWNAKPPLDGEHLCGIARVFGEVITDLDDASVLDRIELDDDIEWFALLGGGELDEVVGEGRADTEGGADADVVRVSGELEASVDV